MQSEPKRNYDETALDDTELAASEPAAVEAEETVVMTEIDFADNVDDLSAEINIEKLVAKVESEDEKEVARKKAIRCRLEEIAEEQSFEDTYAVEYEDN